MRELRILVCNDDGVDSPGLALLADVAHADQRRRLGRGARAQMDSGKPPADVRPRPHARARGASTSTFASGAPADCVIAAFSVLCADRPPDLVLAGINDKRNVGEDAAYSGTMAIAREATFHGVPAIALSRNTRWTDAPAEVAALRRLLGAWWHTRDEWSGDGHWLAVILPDALPAPVVAARIAHDKIGSAVEVLEPGGVRIVFRLRRGRPGSATPGDENAAVQSGAITVVRAGWRGAAPLDGDLTERWAAALADDPPVA